MLDQIDQMLDQVWNVKFLQPQSWNDMIIFTGIRKFEFAAKT